MTEPVFYADPMRLLIASVAGILLLLFLIIKLKLHPVISMMISAVLIGIGAGMPLHMIGETVEKGVGKTLQGIALLIGLGSMFGGILEVSGGAQQMAQTLIRRFGQKKAGWALGLTGLVLGTTVFFEAGVVILIPLAFNVAKQTKKINVILRDPSFGRAGIRICVCSAVSRFCSGCKRTGCESGDDDGGRNSGCTDFHSSCRNYLGKNHRK